MARSIWFGLGTCAMLLIPGCGDDAPGPADTGGATSTSTASGSGGTADSTGDTDSACSCVGDDVSVGTINAAPCATSLITDCGNLEWLCMTVDTCEDAPLTAEQLAVVDCVATTLGSGNAAQYFIRRQDEVAQYSDFRWSIILGDGTAISGGGDSADLVSTRDDVILHGAPDVATVEACRDETSVQATYECLEALTRGDLIETCATDMSF